MSAAVTFDNVSIVFGTSPQAALPLMDEGLERAEIQTRTAQVLGVHDCSLQVQPGEILVLMGLSGSGKSTLLRAVNGLNPVVRGQVQVRGENGLVDVTNADADTLRKIRLNSVAMVFQQFGLLPWRSVRDNVALALRNQSRDAVHTALDVVGLADRIDQIAGDLSYGHQRLLEIAMGVAQSPRLLILDEPTQGLAEAEIEGFNGLIKRLSGGTTILLIEHNMNVVMALADRITVLETGRVLASGLPQQIRDNPAVQEAYLGQAHG